MSTEGLQGDHCIPRQIATLFEDVFIRNLPGWNLDGAYNLSARPSTQLAALQLNKLMHAGPHPWINKAISDHPGKPEFKNALDEVRTVRLA